MGTITTTQRRRVSRRASAAVVFVLLLLVAVPWLLLIPGAIWRGVAVTERCDAKARDQFDGSVTAIRGEERVRWWTPAWTCTLTNGETVAVRGW